MTNQILDYFGNSHASYIHAKGKLSSIKLLEILEVQDNEKILEIGFGTGATLVQLAEQAKATLFGYEMSPLMYQKAMKRIQFCKLTNRINLNLLEKKNHFPAPDNTFDRIYAESIIAIQEGRDLKNLLLEIKRVLKPNGVLLFNETIWLDSTDKNKAKEINEKCKKAFGIIQSTHDFLHFADWKRLLREIGFESEFEIRVNDITPLQGKMTRPFARSNIFTSIGKFKVHTSPAMKRGWKNFQLQMDSIVGHSEKLMEGVLIKSYNKK